MEKKVKIDGATLARILALSAMGGTVGYASGKDRKQRLKRALVGLAAGGATGAGLAYLLSPRKPQGGFKVAPRTPSNNAPTVRHLTRKGTLIFHPEPQGNNPDGHAAVIAQREARKAKGLPAVDPRYKEDAEWLAGRVEKGSVPKIVAPPEELKYYFDEIVPFIKARGNPNDGNPDHAYNNSDYAKGLYNRWRMFVNPNDPVFKEHPDINGYAGDQDGPIWKRFPTLSSMVHELKHLQNLDGLFGIGSGRSKADERRLSNAYKFSPADVSASSELPAAEAIQHEQATTHASHHMQILKELWKAIGRAPTPQEFVDHIQNADKATKLRWRKWSPNGYQDSADERMQFTDEDLDNFTDALENVAKNGGNKTIGKTASVRRNFSGLLKIAFQSSQPRWLDPDTGEDWSQRPLARESPLPKPQPKGGIELTFPNGLRIDPDDVEGTVRQFTDAANRAGVVLDAATISEHCGIPVDAVQEVMYTITGDKQYKPKAKPAPAQPSAPGKQTSVTARLGKLQRLREKNPERFDGIASQLARMKTRNWLRDNKYAIGGGALAIGGGLGYLLYRHLKKRRAAKAGLRTE